MLRGGLCVENFSRPPPMSTKIQLVEDTYDEPLEDILRDLYHGQNLSQAEVANQIETRLATEAAADDAIDPDPPVEIPRSTIAYWFQSRDIECRTSRLSDFERLAILAGFTFGVGNVSIANRLGVGTTTVKRYRSDVHTTGEAVDFNREFKGPDREFIDRLIRVAQRHDHGHGDN